MEVIKVCLNNTKASILFLYFYSAQKNNIIMSSKYIPNRGKTHFVQNAWDWSSKDADYSGTVRAGFKF